MSYLAESKGLLAGEFVRFQTHSASTKRKRVGKGVLLHAVRTRYRISVATACAVFRVRLTRTISRALLRSSGQ
jgi:hypothetical protein